MADQKLIETINKGFRAIMLESSWVNSIHAGGRVASNGIEPVDYNKLNSYGNPIMNQISNNNRANMAKFKFTSDDEDFVDYDDPKYYSASEPAEKTKKEATGFDWLKHI
jgi:hypothetical protein